MPLAVPDKLTGSGVGISTISGCSAGGVAAISSFGGPSSASATGVSPASLVGSLAGFANGASSAGDASGVSRITNRPNTSRTCSATNSDKRRVSRWVWSIDNKSLATNSGRGAYSPSPLTSRATLDSRQLISPFSDSRNAGVADAAKARTRASISSGRPRRAAARIVAFSSPSVNVGWNWNPSSLPTSSPSTSTVPSLLTDAIKFFVSFNLLLKCAARLSTNRSDSRSCKASDNRSSMERARSCHCAGLSVQSERCVM